MMNIKVTCKRDALLDKLQSNRERHAALVQEARGGYMAKAKAALEAKLEKMRQGKLTHLQFTFSPPLDYTASYDTAIAMLKMHQGDSIELSQAEFRQLVEDRWDWRSQFLVSNSQYSGGTAAMRDDDDDVDVD